MNNVRCKASKLKYTCKHEKFQYSSFSFNQIKSENLLINKKCLIEDTLTINKTNSNDLR